MVKHSGTSVFDLLIFLLVYQTKEIFWSNKSRKRPWKYITKIVFLNTWRNSWRKLYLQKFSFSNIETWKPTTLLRIDSKRVYLGSCSSFWSSSTIFDSCMNTLISEKMEKYFFYYKVDLYSDYFNLYFNFWIFTVDRSRKIGATTTVRS